MFLGFLPQLVAATALSSMPTHGAWGLAYADSNVSPRPPIVFLHGMWATPEDSCPSFETAAEGLGPLVCPRGNRPSGAGRMWGGDYASVAPALHAALDGAGSARVTGGTMVGYSNGAYFAAAIARSEPGRWTGLVLLSMRLDLDATRLRDAGVRRIVLGAGDADGAQPSMRALAARLDAAGLPTRFVSLGPMGHDIRLPPGFEGPVREALEWVRSDDAAAR